MATKSREVPAGEFKTKCLALLDEVRDTREEIIVTKRGKPVAKLVPIGRPEIPDLRYMVEWVGDVESPIDVEWEADASTIRLPPAVLERKDNAQ